MGKSPAIVGLGQATDPGRSGLSGIPGVLRRFPALTALFALGGEAFTKHSAIRAALHRDLVQPGRLSQESGRAFDFLMDLRETGDYGGIAQVSAESVELAVQKAEAFVGSVGLTIP